MIKILSFAVLALYLAKIAKDALFWVYLWQVKEYRLDRMRAHFELQSSKKIFLNKAFFVKIALISSAIFLFADLWKFFFQILASAVYAALGLRAIQVAYKKNIKEPIYTKKAISLTVIALTAVTLAALFSFLNFTYTTFLLAIMLSDLLIPVFIAVLVGLFKFPSRIIKERVVKKAKEKRKSLKNMLVIGITGSYGKTSMKEYLSHILAGKLRVLKTNQNTNTEMGVARTVLDKLNENCDVLIVEMGAYKEGEIKKICDIVRPQIGILTGINEQHSSLFGSLEKTISAKYELIESLPKHGMAVFNGDNDYTRKLREKTTRLPGRLYALRGFSVGEKPDITCEKIDFTREGMQFYIRTDENKILFKTKLVGHHNALNIAGAALVANALGMGFDEIKKRVASLEVPDHTMRFFSGINGSTVIDDSYSSNPNGARAALDVMESIRANKKIMVMHPMIELGKYARDSHINLALKINKVCDVCILTSADFEREIRKNAPNTDVLVILNPETIIEKIKKLTREDDIILLENRVPETIKQGLIIK